VDSDLTHSTLHPPFQTGALVACEVDTARLLDVVQHRLEVVVLARSLRHSTDVTVHSSWKRAHPHGALTGTTAHTTFPPDNVGVLPHAVANSATKCKPRPLSNCGAAARTNGRCGESSVTAILNMPRRNSKRRLGPPAVCLSAFSTSSVTTCCASSREPSMSQRCAVWRSTLRACLEAVELACKLTCVRRGRGGRNPTASASSTSAYTGT